MGRATRPGLLRNAADHISIHALRGESDAAPDRPQAERKNFYPRPPWGGRPQICDAMTLTMQFLSTPSVGRATHGEAERRLGRERRRERISIHALRGEGDFLPRCRGVKRFYFYPRPPWGGRLLLIKRVKAAFEFLSTPSVGRATRVRATVKEGFYISIHALRGEGDMRRLPTARLPRYFYPRPPWGGRPSHCIPLPGGSDFYPRPPWGGRLPHSSSTAQNICISIHALRGEGDSCAFCLSTMPSMISIHALRGEGDLGRNRVRGRRYSISIHALRGEGDLRWRQMQGYPADFYPRPPWGGRHVTPYPVKGIQHFYPRPPWGGRRAPRRYFFFGGTISIHALRGEGDTGAGDTNRDPGNFYPRPPWGGRQQKYTKILCIFCAKGTIISPPGGATRRAAAKQPLQHSTT